jgi:hypothetical protein
MRRLVAYVVANFVVIMVMLFFSGRVLNASELPFDFKIAGSFSCNVGELCTGIGSLEIGPDGKLWIFGMVDQRLSEIQTIDPIDEIFFNGNDILSPRFGSTGNGAVFTPDNKLLSFSTESDTASLINAVDGVFFNGNDSVQNFIWPFGQLVTFGLREPSPAAFDPKGILYITQYNHHIAIFDPIDGDMSNNNFSFSRVALPVEPSGSHFGIAFDNHGNMFLAEFQQGGGKLTGIDSVDSIFFNGNDVSRVYAWSSILAGVSSSKGGPAIIDIAFAAHGNLIVFDAGTEMLHTLTPIFDSDDDGIPNDEDTCPNSILSDTVVIDECDSGVDNTLFVDDEDFGNGCTIADLIMQIAADANNHGQFVSGVAQFANDLNIAPFGRAFKHPSLSQGPDRCALDSYVPRLITSPSS